MFDQWKEDPNSVHPSWKIYFNNIEEGAEVAYVAPPTIGQKRSTGESEQLQQVLKLLQSQDF